MQAEGRPVTKGAIFSSSFAGTDPRWMAAFQLETTANLLTLRECFGLFQMRLEIVE
jgi:hypothetical protein